MPTDPTPERTLLSLTQQVTGFARLNTARGTPVHRAATELLARVEAMGWQPIESAPRDGTVVLVAVHTSVFGWVLGYSHWESFVQRGPVPSEVAGWLSKGFWTDLGLAHPTHWQPLPPPPVVSTGEHPAAPLAFQETDRG